MSAKRTFCNVGESLKNCSKVEKYWAAAADVGNPFPQRNERGGVRIGPDVLDFLSDDLHAPQCLLSRFQPGAYFSLQAVC